LILLLLVTGILMSELLKNATSNYYF